MTPIEIEKFVRSVVNAKIMKSLMIWGAPGIGKSSIVETVARSCKLDLIDLRLSQLAPTDLRGLPGIHEGKSKWYVPEFLPRKGTGILFLDEINMAPPVMQGVAQQLILDRAIGAYKVPDGWYVWAAGNRREDQAAVFQMPSALSNRFIHVTVEPDIKSFSAWGLANGLSEQVLSFLAFRPSLLHKIDSAAPAWPSPRSWVLADDLFKADLSIEPAVGPAGAEFDSFIAIYGSLPDFDSILDGRSKAKFPEEPSKRYAITTGLCLRINNAENALNALRWLSKVAESEWVQLMITSLFPVLRSKGIFGDFVNRAKADSSLMKEMNDIRDLIVGG
jgi:hypothetical protein